MLVRPRRLLGAAAASMLVTAAAASGATADATADSTADTSGPVTTETPVVTSDLTPNVGHIATPADDVMHAGVITEWWYVTLMDPASKRQFIAVVSSAPTPQVVGTLLFNDGVNSTSSTSEAPAPTGIVSVLPPANDGLPGVRSTAASLDYSALRKAYHLTMTPGLLGTGYAADVWLDSTALPGATGIIDLKHNGQWMGWTSPVATSTVHGWIKAPGGQRIAVDGWRGYHDHNWGNFTIADQQSDGWEWGVSFEPDGGATIVGGVVRRGSEWAGSLVDVRPTGTRSCAATTLELTDWKAGSSPMSGLTYPLPGTIKAICAPQAGGDSTRAQDSYDYARTFHLVDAVVADGGLVAASVEAPYNTVAGSFGVFEHIRTLLSRLEQQPVLAPLTGITGVL